jgi:hypothetical protein
MRETRELLESLLACEFVSLAHFSQVKPTSLPLKEDCRSVEEGKRVKPAFEVLQAVLTGH